MTEQIGDATITRSSILMPGGLPWSAQLGDIVARGSTREAAIDALRKKLAGYQAECARILGLTESGKVRL